MDTKCECCNSEKDVQHVEFFGTNDFSDGVKLHLCVGCRAYFPNSKNELLLLF